MKYFSLIYGDKLAEAKKEKVIPAKEFSTMLDSKELVQVLKEEAEKFKLEIAKECEVLKENAEKEGFDKGYEAWAERKALYNKELDRVKEEMEKMLVPLVMEASKKFVGTALEEKPSLITEIVENKLRAVANDKKITIHVNKQDLEQLEKDKDRLKKVLEAVQIFLIQEKRDVAPGGCVIETENGIINAQWDKQWERIEELFKKLAEK